VKGKRAHVVGKKKPPRMSSERFFFEGKRGRKRTVQVISKTKEERVLSNSQNLIKKIPRLKRVLFKEEGGRISR